jgi:hypothetical protein
MDEPDAAAGATEPPVDRSLPDLCMQLVADRLQEVDPPYFRLQSDVVRDALAIGAASKDLRMRLSGPLLNAMQAVHPMYTSLFRKPSSSSHPRVKQLKECCKHLGLRVGGVRADLIERLHGKVAADRARMLEDARMPYVTGLSGWKLREVCAYIALDVEVDLPKSRTQKTIVTIPWLVRLGVAKHGSAREVHLARERLEEHMLEQVELRKTELQQALQARGCQLRNDSVLCDAYVQHGSGQGGHGGQGRHMDLEAVVDATEEIQFYYRLTPYSAILQALRHQDRERHQDSYRDFHRDRDSDGSWSDYTDSSDEADEEARRGIAKQKALRIWLSNPANDRSALPRSLCARGQPRSR